MLQFAALFLLLAAPALLQAQTTSPLTPVPVPVRPSAPVPELPHPVLDRIQAAHALTCGLAKEEEDYSRDEDHGNRAALDIDVCNAVAVATLGSGSHVTLKSYPDEAAAVKALTTGEIDLLASTSLSVANSALGLLFTSPVLYDGQGLLILNNSNVHSPLDLAGKKVCFATGSTAEIGLHSYAAEHGIQYIWYPFSEDGEMEAAFFTANCDAISSDVSRLANIRAIDPKRAHDFTILPQLIRQDPLAAATMGSDPRFAAIVHWTVETLIEAEALGVTQANVHSLAASTRPELQQLLGQRYGTGTRLGLDPHWGANVIDAVGNYGEIFDRDLGSNSNLRLYRGESRLWTNGGVLYGVLPSIH